MSDLPNFGRNSLDIENTVLNQLGNMFLECIWLCTDLYLALQAGRCMYLPGRLDNL